MDNAVLATVVSDLKTQFLQKDYSTDFTNWHGQPLWDKAIELKKDAGNAIVLIPTSKAGNVEAFIAALVKDGTVVYELHRRKAVEANVQEPSGVNINPVFSRGMLAYFNNSIYNKVDQVPDAVYYTLQKAAERNGDAAPSPDKMVSVAICYNVGYCTDCPNAPEVCCYTQKICFNITYDDGTGGGIIIGGGTGGGPHGGGPGPGSGCPPAQSNWFSENPAPAPCDPVPPATCSMSAQEANAYLAGITLQNLNDYHYTFGLQSEGGAVGDIIRVPKILDWDFLSLKLPLGFNVRYTAFFPGVIYKQGQNDPDWKWESLRYAETKITDGGPPFCVTLTMANTVTPPILSADNRNAYISMAYSVTAKINTPFYSYSGVYTGLHPSTEFDANWK